LPFRSELAAKTAANPPVLAKGQASAIAKRARIPPTHFTLGFGEHSNAGKQMQIDLKQLLSACACRFEYVRLNF
jgi:hypothetical protein